MICRLTKEILDLCRTHNIRLFPSHLPGLANTESDALSRGKTQEEWHLSPVVAQNIFRVFGVPDIDLFASQRTAQVPDYSPSTGTIASLGEWMLFARDGITT
jgi:hypothetical protein